MNLSDVMKTKSNIYPLLLLLIFIIISIFYKMSQAEVAENQNKNEILGFGFLDKIIGLWNGKVFSDTPAGSFDAWYVDFRPVSSSEVVQFSNLDTNTIDYISFFIVKHDNKLKIAMRTEGVFMNKGCVTYEVLDSADEEHAYYRFSDFCAGKKRAFTEFIFKDDNLIMQTFTNKFNTLDKPKLHSKWEAIRVDTKNAEIAKKYFKYPQHVMIKDFTNAFKNMSESIYFTFENDPYPSSSIPYVGSVTFDIKTDEKLRINKSNE